MVVAIRDLDGLETKGAKWRQRQAYFRKVATAVEHKSLPLLHIYEIEALICADIAKFNRLYGCNCAVPTDPMTIPEPKEWLIAATAPGKPRYAEGNCATLLATVDYDTLLANCRYFASFDHEFSQHIPPA